MQHAEDFNSEDSQESQYYAAYEDWSAHRVMLSDEPRMDFYKHILADPDNVCGKVVIDVGSGTGILSAWAALAGAAHVFSIEASTMATVQHLVFEENGVSDSVTIIHSTVEVLIERGVGDFIKRHDVVRKAGGVSLVVSEWMGFHLFHEGMLPSVLRARDFFNDVNDALGGRVSLNLVPSSATLFAAPVTLQPFYDKVIKPFWSSVGGVRMGSLGHHVYEHTIDAASPLVEALPPDCLLHEGETLWHSDLLTLSVACDLCVEKTVHFEFGCSEKFKSKLEGVGAVTMDGLALWFEVCYADSSLSTSPCAPPTHWKQTVMSLPPYYRRHKIVSFHSTDESLAVTLTLRPTEHNPRCYKLEFELD